MREPVWWSLCCGLDATASWAMAKRRPPVSRMGGKRAYSADVLRILGDWPKTWCMVDADPAIVLWWSAVFGGWLGEVAERIRAYDLDGEELWRLIVYANGKDGTDGPAKVPNPMAFAGEQAWLGVAGWGDVGTGFGVGSDSGMAERVATWQGVAGYGHVSEAGGGDGALSTYARASADSRTPGGSEGATAPERW